MIVSRQYEYLFVELPHTASTAISHELCEKYDGVEILHKHAHYHEFLEVATREERNYFVFAGIRNPLDVAVTLYFKKKTNHQGFFTNPIYWRKHGGHVSRSELEVFHFIQEEEADFPTCFKRFYKLPYDSWGSPSPDDFDFIIHYENLQQDFATVLDRLGIEQVRPLPLINKTEDKGNYLSYYTPDIRDQARRIFGPYMRLWGYDFPSEWEKHYVPWFSQVLFHTLRFFRKQLLWGPRFYARLFRRLRETL